MSDFGEWAPLDAVVSDGSDPLRYHETFPVSWHRQWRTVMDELRPDGDFAVFARSGSTGVHEVAQIYWIGDQECDFEATDGLPTVVPAMLNLGLSGIPFVTHDIAGFSGGPSTKELFMRWTELGAFTPIMRTHEGSDKENNWRWESDEETIAHFRRFARIHVALGEELQVLAELAAQRGTPMVRALMLEFPDDAQTHGISDSFLLGPDLLVAPVVEAGASTREVYLPAGASWFHVWSGDTFGGGETVTVPAPLGQPPVFSRDVDRPDLRAIGER
jgi:alpha-glucosidase